MYACMYPYHGFYSDTLQVAGMAFRISPWIQLINVKILGRGGTYDRIAWGKLDNLHA